MKLPDPDVAHTHSQREILTHSDLSNGPSSTESFPHYQGISNPKGRGGGGREGMNTARESKREAERRRGGAQGGSACRRKNAKRQKKGDVVNEYKHGGEMRKPVVSRGAAGLVPA